MNEKAPDGRRLRDVMGLAPDGRRVHHWRCKDPKKDLNELADAIAATGELFDRDGTIVRLDEDGTLVAINPAALKEFISERICGVRAVRRGGPGYDQGWQREFFTYEFAQEPKVTPTRANPKPDAVAAREPDDKTLMEIYTKELLWRLPKVI